jgi:acyl-CoA reductase-like NAD-dependent aldehyde dehydrogenase
MILNASQLSALRQRNDEELRKGKYAKYGYPAHTIQDLLQTVESIKKEKKKWQRLAQERGQYLEKISELAGKMEER